MVDRPLYTSGVSRNLRKLLSSALITLFAFACLVAYLSPFGYMVMTALKNRQMMAKPGAPIWPALEASFTYEGEEELSFTLPDGKDVVVKPGDSFPVYKVPFDGHERSLALVVKGREESYFLDPHNLEEGLIRWEGRWRTLETAWQFAPQWGNFKKAWTEIKFPRLLRNTIAIALIGDIGTLLSCTLVAYGFSRFRFPGKDVLFIILIGTIILPGQVTLIPTYAFFTRINWVGTWKPLTVPHFFANAYNVFLLRQYFMTIPRELDEAAMIDGAGPFRRLISVILPQSVPVILTVFLFHFMWAWNDYFNPYIYLSTRPDLQPISVGIYAYNAMYFAQPHMIQTTALMGLVLPVTLFFIAQRAFIRGVVITGVEK